MSEIEFILIGISMVLAIALGKLVEGVVELSGDKSRYWLHCGWVLSRIIAVILYFWTFRAAVSGEVDVDWTFGAFLVAMAGPVTTLMQAHLLLTRNTESFPDWQTHFYSIRRRFFLFGVIQQLTNILALLFFVLPMSWLPLILLMGLSFAGMVWSNARLHALIVCTYLAVQAVGLAVPIVAGFSQ